MAGTQAQGIDRNIDAAARFLDRVKDLSPSERARVSRESFGSSAHTSAMMMIADEVSALKNKDRDGRVSSFLVELEQRVDEMGLDAEAGDLVKAAPAHPSRVARARQPSPGRRPRSSDTPGLHALRAGCAVPIGSRLTAAGTRNLRRDRTSSGPRCPNWPCPKTPSRLDLGVPRTRSSDLSTHDNGCDYCASDISGGEG